MEQTRKSDNLFTNASVILTLYNKITLVKRTFTRFEISKWSLTCLNSDINESHSYLRPSRASQQHESPA